MRRTRQARLVVPLCRCANHLKLLPARMLEYLEVLVVRGHLGFYIDVDAAGLKVRGKRRGLAAGDAVLPQKQEEGHGMLASSAKVAMFSALEVQLNMLLMLTGPSSSMRDMLLVTRSKGSWMQ